MPTSPMSLGRRLATAVVATAGILAFPDAFAVPTCVTEPAGSAAWYRAEDNANDTRGSNHGTNSGTYSAGRVGRAFSFNGTSGYVSVPDNATLEPASITVEAWVNLSLVGPTAMIVSKPVGSGTANSYQMYYQSGNLVAEISDGGGTRPKVLAPWAPSAGTWYHVAMTYDGTILKAFIDGAQAGGDTLASIPLTYGTNPLMIGAEDDGSGAAYFFPGLIDEVTIYSRALSSAEIASLSGAGALGKCSPTLVTHTNDFGYNSLREAITYANTHCTTGPHSISFDIPGAGPHVISSTGMPTITCSGTVIDGYTQPGAVANTLSNGSNNADIRIQVDSSSPASCYRAFGTNLANNVIFRGLSITRFACDAIYVNTCTGCALEGSYINVTPAGVSTTGTGIYLNTLSSGGVIGGATSAQHNLWAGGGQIYMNTSPVLVKNNRFNVGRDGAPFATNRMSTPIYLNATGATITENIFLSASSQAIYVGNGGNSITNNQFKAVGQAVYLSSGSGTTVSNNTIIDTTAEGIYVGAPSNIIQSNTITNSAYSGIYVVGNSNTVSSNLIEDSDRWGIENSASNVLYQSNTIRNNLQGGIKVFGDRVRIRGNSIYSNGGPGIDLGGDGATANDEAALPYDADAGANDLVNHPVITSISYVEGSTVVGGTLRAAPPNAAVFIDLFSHPAMPAVNGGQTY